MRNNIRQPQISRTIYTRDTVVPQIAPNEEPIPVETPIVTSDETTPNVQLPISESKDPATGNSK
jgi:hypothetical protein